VPGSSGPRKAFPIKGQGQEKGKSPPLRSSRSHIRGGELENQPPKAKENGMIKQIQQKRGKGKEKKVLKEQDFMVFD